MTEELTGNLLVAQSGGPTCVINSSLAGIIAEALNQSCIEEIYGGLNGVEGIISEDLIDLAEESQQNIRALRYSPGAALGTCRYKLKKDQDLERILEVFKSHNIRYFFYIGGNDSQDTADKISKYAQSQGYELRVIGLPKTIDNDLCITDHCPGYASAVKYVCTTVRQIEQDHESMSKHDLVSIIEVMGRSTGWIAAGATLAKGKNSPQTAPHLIYMPEVPFAKEKFLQDVQTVLQSNKHCMVIVSEGIVDASGNYVSAEIQGTDGFGHTSLGGVGETLRLYLEEGLDVKARTCKLGYAQRSAVTNASKTDSDEAFMCGQAAVKAAVKGATDKMVTLVRGDTDMYTCETGLISLDEIANAVKNVPKSWINEDGVSLNHQFVKYALPLIQGEIMVPYEHGLPKFVKLSKTKVEKVLTAYAVA